MLHLHKQTMYICSENTKASANTGFISMYSNLYIDTGVEDFMSEILDISDLELQREG